MVVAKSETIVGTAPVGEDGTSALVNLPPGAYRVAALGSTANSAGAAVEVGEGQTASVVIRATASGNQPA